MDREPSGSVTATLRNEPSRSLPPITFLTICKGMLSWQSASGINLRWLIVSKLTTQLDRLGSQTFTTLRRGPGSSVGGAHRTPGAGDGEDGRQENSRARRADPPPGGPLRAVKRVGHDRRKSERGENHDQAQHRPLNREARRNQRRIDLLQVLSKERQPGHVSYRQGDAEQAEKDGH